LKHTPGDKVTPESPARVVSIKDNNIITSGYKFSDQCLAEKAVPAGHKGPRHVSLQYKRGCSSSWLGELAAPSLGHSHRWSRTESFASTWVQKFLGADLYPPWGTPVEVVAQSCVGRRQGAERPGACSRRAASLGMAGSEDKGTWVWRVVKGDQRRSLGCAE
jgi:hypothetical protein